jgi:predicted AAA+ superfamily ATPase
VEFKGAMAENAVLQSLLHQWEVAPRYWTSGATAEVDFVLQADLEVIPIEVKAGVNIRARSLSVYADRYQPTRAVRYSLNNQSRDGRLLNIPLFLADWTRKLLEIQ